jgi:hypothetical protein
MILWPFIFPMGWSKTGHFFLKPDTRGKQFKFIYFVEKIHGKNEKKNLQFYRVFTFFTTKKLGTSHVSLGGTRWQAKP